MAFVLFKQNTICNSAIDKIKIIIDSDLTFIKNRTFNERGPESMYILLQRYIILYFLFKIKINPNKNKNA